MAIHRSLALALTLLIGSHAHRSLPSGITCGSQFSSPEAPLVVPNPKISWANYAIFDCNDPIAWYEATTTENQLLEFTITVPVIPRFEDVRMSVVIVGEGLPDLNQDGSVPDAVKDYVDSEGVGAVIFHSPEDQSTCAHLTSEEMIEATTVQDSRCHFYEPFGGSNFWVVLDDNYSVPMSSTYKIALYESNSSTAKASLACCAFPEDFLTLYDIPQTTCPVCGTGSNNTQWSSLFHEHKDMAQYGGYPPLQNCAVDNSPIELPSGDQCPPIDEDSEEEEQPESCALGCNIEGECHSHNVFGECTHLLDWTLTPKFGEAEVSNVIIYKGDKIKFTAPDNLAHNLYMMADESSLEQCTFEGSTTIADVGEIFSGHEVVFDEAGIFYFSCSITGHCLSGQKFVVEVKDASEGLKCHDHSDLDGNLLSVPLSCLPEEVNVRAVNNPDYGTSTVNECAELCVPAGTAQFLTGSEVGSCASLGFIHNARLIEILIPGSPMETSVTVVSNITDVTCHCHSYEEITCAEDDALYKEHIEEIEEYCNGIVDGSEESCPYKCFQPIEVLHLHYIECSSRAVDATYNAVNATNKCHIAATVPPGVFDCPVVILGQNIDSEESQDSDSEEVQPDDEPDSSSLRVTMSFGVRVIMTIVVSLTITCFNY